MKLFLASLGMTPGLLPHLTTLWGTTTPQPIRTLIIPNASDYKGLDKQALLAPFNHVFAAPQFDYAYLDLRNYIGDQQALARRLQQADFIWVPGGNTFLLRWLMECTGFAPLLQQFLDNGGVYGGGSAGAMVLAPSLAAFATCDDPAAAPEQIDAGLGITPFTVIPHIDSSDAFAALHKRTKDDTQYIALTDNQAVVVDGSSQTIANG